MEKSQVEDAFSPRVCFNNTLAVTEKRSTAARAFVSKLGKSCLVSFSKSQIQSRLVSRLLCSDNHRLPILDMKTNNYEVVEAGETIKFQGLIQRSKSQAYFLVFCTAIGMVSLALVLDIQFKDLGK